MTTGQMIVPISSSPLRDFVASCESFMLQVGVGRMGLTRRHKDTKVWEEIGIVVRFSWMVVTRGQMIVAILFLSS